MATTLRPRASGAHAAPARPLLPGLAVAVAAAVIALAAAMVLPDIPAAGRMTTTPTHYMGLLMANQPWNLLLFMAVPFAVIYLGLLPAALGLFPSRLGRAAVAFLAVYLTVASVYLLRWAVVPLTGQLRGNCSSCARIFSTNTGKLRADRPLRNSAPISSSNRFRYDSGSRRPSMGSIRSPSSNSS